MKLANANGQSVEFKDALRKAVEVVMHFTYPNFLPKVAAVTAKRN